MQFTLNAIEKGECPYYSLALKSIPGNEVCQIYGGVYGDIRNVWDILSVGLSLTTDATVANRVASIYILGPDGANYALASALSPNVTASTANVNLQLTMQNYFSTNTVLGVEYLGGLTYPPPLVGPKGSVYINIANGVVGDKYDVDLLVMFKNHLLGMREPYQYKIPCQGGC